jgi:serine/threonine-protein kinase RsbW
MGGLFTFSIDNRLDELPRLLDAVDAYLQSEKIPCETANRVQIALDELISNTIRWGYDDGKVHSLLIELAKKSSELNMIIADDGRHFDPTASPAPNILVAPGDRSEGGLGIYLARNMANITYRRRGNQNVVELKFEIDN